jgi:CRP/FNR family transcriptional regulator, cyclic AMP receptor protein
MSASMDKISILSTSPLFEMLSNAELELIAELSQPRRFGTGQTLFQEGELGDGLYVIISGEVAVLRRGEEEDEQVIAVLSAPQFFGEMSLIEKEYRSATTRARSEAELLHLTGEDLAEFRKQYPDGFTHVVINIARVLSARLRQGNARLSLRR